MVTRIGSAVKNGLKNVAVRSKNKFVNFWTQVSSDYRAAASDLAEVCRNKPIKASIYTGCASIMTYLYWNKPTAVDFRQNYIDFHHDLAMVSSHNKNKVSQQYCDRVTKCYNHGTLRFWSLGIATLVWEDNFDSNSGLFEAQCDYLKPTYRQILEDRLIDIGINGNWKMSEKIMKDFDINIDEWDDKGYPINAEEQLKPLY